jgi:ComF family protein
VGVPLHKIKLKQRGFNQSEQIAKGIAEYLKIEEMSHLVIRNKNTETQTKKSRMERNENVTNIFEITTPHVFENKHILIVDDVITTGATLEYCALEFLKIKGCKISVAGLAFAGH